MYIALKAIHKYKGFNSFQYMAQTQKMTNRQIDILTIFWTYKEYEQSCKALAL